MLQILVIISVLEGVALVLLWLVAEQRNSTADRWHQEAMKLQQDLMIARNTAESRRLRIIKEEGLKKALKRKNTELREELLTLKEAK